MPGASEPAARPFAGRTVLAVFAHPDDESLACGGTLARLADAGVRVVLLCATEGERGTSVDPALVPDGDLGRVRVAELHRAAAVLGISDVIVKAHPDGCLRWADVPELHAEIVAAVEQYRPDAVITFAEDGLYWHLDHVGVYERTCTALRTFGAAAPPLYGVTMPKGIMRGVFEAAVAGGWTRPPFGTMSLEPDAFGDAASPPSLVVDVRGWVSRKIAALLCHRTQFRPGNPFALLSPEDARRLIGHEHFRRAAIDSRPDLVFERFAEPVVNA